MSHLRKFILISTIICLMLGMGAIVFAQETTDDIDLAQDITLDEEVSAQDLEISEPKLLPDSRFYFLKEWDRSLRSLFTFNKVKKAELESKFANEKLIELKKLTEKGVAQEIIQKAVQNYEKTLNKIKTRAEKIKEKAEDNPELNKFMEKYTNQQILHQKLLEKLEDQVPAQVLEKIEETRERHLENFREVMIKLENKEQIKERLENAVKNQEGSEFKDFKSLEILKKIREKMPEDIKEEIKETEGEILNTLKIKLENMSEEKQEKFQEYVEIISGNKEKQLEILEDLKIELKTAMPMIVEKIEISREKIMEKVQERVRATNCPEIQKPASGFCPAGRVIIEKDESGCVKSFECVKPADSSTISPNTTQTACITLWDPVCGTNNKTYSNKCFAQRDNIQIAYQGVCGSNASTDSSTKIDNNLCVKTTGEKLDITEARRIALNSECAKVGAFKADAVCNKITGTWWISINADKEGCYPACVVDVITQKAEINWRCTGAVEPTGEATGTIEVKEVKETVELKATGGTGTGTAAGETGQ